MMSRNNICPNCGSGMTTRDYCHECGWSSRFGAERRHKFLNRIKGMLDDGSEISNIDVRKLYEEVIDMIDRGGEAAEHVESPIVMRTGFTGSPPYVGWKGIGLALTEALDERDKLRERLREIHGISSPDL